MAVQISTRKVRKKQPINFLSPNVIRFNFVALKQNYFFGIANPFWVIPLLFFLYSLGILPPSLVLLPTHNNMKWLYIE
jgi:hypothetical protein